MRVSFDAGGDGSAPPGLVGNALNGLVFSDGDQQLMFHSVDQAGAPVLTSATIAGGTGKFAGATGTVMTRDFLSTTIENITLEVCILQVVPTSSISFASTFESNFYSCCTPK
jgi:hypothetical protein